MKSNGDLGQKWLKLAEAEFAAAEGLIEIGQALQGACFHCQQAAEKALKAWLIAHDVDPPKTHELKDLIALSTSIECRFNEFLTDADALTEYAVERRYDADFWPTLDQARTALEQAQRIYEFVKSHWDK
jgi:HEPN domain-containing protein